MTEERIRRVLDGLRQCGKETLKEDGCPECPYCEMESCTISLAGDAYDVLVEMLLRLATTKGGAG